MKYYSKAVGPKLYPLLVLVLVVTTLLSINSLYLAGITFYEWFFDVSVQDAFYLWMFLLHLVLGILLISPLMFYAFIHARNASSYKNKTAKRAGYLMLISSIVLIVSGLLLTRFTEDFEALNSHYRSAIYWVHVLLPLLCGWLFVLHRLAGRNINLKIGKWVVLLTLVAMFGYLIFQNNENTITSDNSHLTPTFATTKSGDLIPPNVLNNNLYCVGCHEDTHEQWLSSVHHFSSFNNPAYAFAVNNTRQKLIERDGHADAARLCAACHDPVLLFSGEFDNLSKEDEKGHNAQAGLTCSSCHLIEQINNHKGNGAYQLAPPTEYPLTQSVYKSLQWVNHLLVKSKPDKHKTTYLKPFHKEAEFCSTCHKVSLPESLNDFRWLRGQNHYDSFLLSGVSGHKVTSFYYPQLAKKSCNDCHMKAVESDDIAANYDAGSNLRTVKNHRFDVANTAIRYLNKRLDRNDHSELLKKSVSIDLIGIKSTSEESTNFHTNDGSTLNLKRGETHILETVLKTNTLGHQFTQGTADSNQIWLALSLYHENKLIAQSGGLNRYGELDPFAHHVNAYVIDRDGNKIQLRNAEDIYTVLYNNQIPPGAAAVVHYEITNPEEIIGEFRIEAELYYRKFNTTYYRSFMNKPDLINDLPVVLINQAKLTFSNKINETKKPAEINWKRWNDYGIALLRNQEYKSAIKAFEHVVAAGQSEGIINLLRVHLKEGRLNLAKQQLDEAKKHGGFPYPWQLDYFEGRIHFLNGRIDQSISAFHRILENKSIRANSSDFDFSKDYEFLTELAQAYVQMAITDSNRQQWIDSAVNMYNQILSINSEWAPAYYGLFTLAKINNNQTKAEQMREQYEYYKIDDQTNDSAIASARNNDPAADKAANRLIIYKIEPNAKYPLTLKRFQKYSGIKIIQ